jgi:hypothetical protein
MSRQAKAKIGAARFCTMPIGTSALPAAAFQARSLARIRKDFGQPSLPPLRLPTSDLRPPRGSLPVLHVKIPPGDARLLLSFGCS